MERLKLPPAVISQMEIARLRRELNSLNDFFVSAASRVTGTTMQLPRLTRLLDQLAHENKINLLEESDREKLTKDLDEIAKHAPLMHVSFASEPSPQALEEILVWLRDNIHPHSLLQVGLQPAIAAGCILRTPNHVFDLSLRATLNKQTSYLVELIQGAVNG